MKDVLVGDLWLASGQSNMRWKIKQSKDAKQHIPAAEHPDIRLFDLTADVYPTSRAYDLDVLRKTDEHTYYSTDRWQPCTPETAATFLAVAYHFAEYLQSHTGVPIGIIHNAIGGTPMEAWIPESAIAADKTLRKMLPNWLTNPYLPSWTNMRARQNLKAYFDALDGPLPHPPFEPGFLYQAGVAPFTNLPINGVIWYQGESNATQDGASSPPIDPVLNKHTFTKLIESWRSAFSNPELPFYFVQLPGLNREWPMFREMQLQVSEEIPHTGMAVTMDLGHPTNVHPPDKQPVGERLARLALADLYGEKIAGRSPRVLKRGNSFLVYDQELTTTDGGAPKGFAIADERRQFYPASAKIHDNIVHVASEEVPKPEAIRYAWANGPAVNLISTTGLPVSPFRTDKIKKQAAPVPQDFSKFDGRWHSGEGLVELDKKLARSGGRCVHLLGSVEFTPENIGADSKLEFWAERWTGRDPFAFRIEAVVGGDWREIHNGDQTTKVGRGFRNHIVLPIAKGTTSFRFKSTAPEGTGVLIDDLRITEAKPMKFLGVGFTAQVNPILIGKKYNPLLQFTIRCEGDLEPKRLTGLQFTNKGAILPEGCS